MDQDLPQDEISLSEIWAVLYARKVIIVSVTLLAGVLAAASSYLIRPVFRAEALVSPATEQKNSLGALAAQFGGLADLAGVNMGGGGDRAAAIATLKSRSLTEKFIQEMNLLPVLFENDWDAENKRWKVTDPEKIPALWDAYRMFDTVRRIDDDRKTGLVTISVEWYDPKAASDWANELVRRANAKLQQDKIAEGEKAITYLEQQLVKASAVEVRQALYSLIEVETKNIAVAHAREEFAFKVIDPAVPSKKKFKPNRPLLVLTGLFLGLSVGCLWTLFAARKTLVLNQ